MQVTAPPRSTETPDDRDLAERVAALEALIEEARRRARRRRQRNGAAALLVAAAGVAALIGFGRHGGGAGSAATARAHGSQGSPAHTESPPLGALPPDAGTVESFAFDPHNPEIVYVLAVSSPFGPARSHVYKTIDGGAHWKATPNRGWVGSNEALTADPRHPGTLYAGTERAVYKTVDGGKSWRPSKRGLFAPPHPYQFNRVKGWVVALAVDPGNTNIVYAGSDRVSKSTDGGRTWQTVFPSHLTHYPGDDVSALAIASTRPEAIYAITSDYASPSPTPARGRTSIYKSTNAGATWQPTTVVRGSVAPTTLAVDPQHPTTVYAAIGAKVMKTTNGGETWQSIADGLPISDTRGGCHCLSQGGVKALTVDPRRAGIVVYAALTQGGIYKTTDGGHTWIRSVGNVLLSRDIVAVDPSRPATVYAAGESDTGSGPRVFRSTNGGQTWTIAG